MAEFVTLTRKAASEATGTAFLLATVIGSGIMGERLSGGNVAIALLANTLATGAALVALILTFGPVSGAHFNPAVTLADASQGGVLWREIPAYIAAQVGGAFLGVAAAHLMFGEPLFSVSLHARGGAAQSTGNSARSQMAEGILRHDGGDAFEVESAGAKPGGVRFEAIQVMREIGIDISGHRSKSVDEFIGREFDTVITVCDNAKETCPVFPGKTERVHRNFEDPPPPGVGSDEERLSIFRRVRDEIREWMKDFIAGQMSHSA